jgi:hypothetical protein
MVILFLIRRAIAILLGALSTLLSLVHISPILSTFRVHIPSQFVYALTSIHYSHFLHVLRYLRGTISHRLFFPCSDATWASDPSDRRSLSAYCVFLGGSLIAWKTKKQTAVFCSSVEAELRAKASLMADVTWLSWLLEDFGVSVTDFPLVRY